MDVGCPKKFGGSGDPAPLRWGVSDPLETRLSPTSVTAASLVVLGRAIFTYILWRILNFRILPSTINWARKARMMPLLESLESQK